MPRAPHQSKVQGSGTGGGGGGQGPQGDPGAAGASGVPGFPGEEGDEGKFGPPGERGAAGADGAPGTQGAPGVPGFPGDEGDQGQPGPPGAKGDKGDTGTTGDPGAQGTPGVPGFHGDDGDDGRFGPPGAAGAAGADGAPGAAGAQGVPGFPGQDGDDGQFGVGVPGAAGAAGNDGAPGAQGAAGIPGFPGPEGDDGQFGVPGRIGVDGATGATGPQGPALPWPGPEGDEGPMGFPGPTGPQGATGADGAPGSGGGGTVIPGFPGEDGADAFFLPGPPGLSGGSWTEFTVNLGAARRSGTFDVTGFSGLTVGAPVLVVQSGAAIASKGSATDESEMNNIQVAAYALTTSSIRCFWYSDAVCVGTYAFAATPNLAGSGGGGGTTVPSRGRPKPSGLSAYLVLPGVYIQGIQTRTLAANFDTFMPIFVHSSTTVDALKFNVTISAAGNARVGIYAADTDWQPSGAPLYDSGNISVSTTGVKTATPGSPLVLAAGRYLLCWISDVAPELRSLVGQVPGVTAIDTGLGSSFRTFWNKSRAYAAFPNPATWDGDNAIANNNEYYVFLSVSTP